MSKGFELWRKTARWPRGSKCKEASRCPHTPRNYTAHGTHRLAAGNGIGRERRHSFHIESGTRRGVAAAHATHSDLLVAGVAGLVAGAMSMAAGEYVSVHSQADTEEVELKLERAELKAERNYAFSETRLRKSGPAGS
jgi:hypothetical protein